MNKSHLRFMILYLLSKNSLSGYGIMKSIGEQTKCWKPSTGSVYPLLIRMEHEGALSVVIKGRRKEYSLTPKGRRELEGHLSRKEEIIDHIYTHFKVALSLLSKQEARKILAKLEEEVKKE